MCGLSGDVSWEGPSFFLTQLRVQLSPSVLSRSLSTACEAEILNLLPDANRTGKPFAAWANI